MLFYLDLSRKKICLKLLRSKNFKQKLCHQVVEVEALSSKGTAEAEVIYKLPLPHP